MQRAADGPVARAGVWSPRRCMAEGPRLARGPVSFAGATRSGRGNDSAKAPSRHGGSTATAERRAPDAVREGGCGRPRGPWLSVPASGQRRHRRAALGGGSAAGSGVVRVVQVVRAARWCGPMTLSKAVTGRGKRYVEHRPGCASPGATVSTGCGRSRASPGPTTPSDVTGLLSPADRSRHRSEVPRRGPLQAVGVSSLRLSARGAASTRSPAGRAWLTRHREQRTPSAAGHAPYG